MDNEQQPLEVKRIDGIEYEVQPMKLQDWMDAGRPGETVWIRTGLRMFGGWGTAGSVVQEVPNVIEREGRWYHSYTVRVKGLPVTMNILSVYGSKTVFVYVRTMPYPGAE